MIRRNHGFDNVINDPGRIAELEEEDIAEILKEVQPIFHGENALLDLEGTVAFVGDLHGDFPMAQAIVKQFSSSDHLVFLGDYIDREPVQWGSLLTMTYLLTLKSFYPKKIILLRGNHESNSLISCFPYEFEEEIVQRFGSGALHEQFVEVFAEMPLMVLSHRIFAAHGGIVKGTNLQTLRTIKKNDVAAVTSLVWSDPALSSTYRGVGEKFNESELHQFLDGISAQVFVRGHDHTMLGYSIYGDRCLTLFSSTQYQGEGNRGILVACTEKDINRASDLTVEDYSQGHWTRYHIGRL
jgi:protein phosphatase